MRKLFLDLERAPTLGYFYDRYGVNISPTAIVDNGFIVSVQWAYDDEPVQSLSLRHIKKPLKSKDDKPLVVKAIELMDKADVVIAHNAIKFDLAVIAARCAVHGIKPPPPINVVDTLKACRRFFKFEANSLNAVCQELGLGKKFSSGGMDTMLACMKCDQEAWDTMLEYGEHDVTLLRDLYYKIRPFIKDHPNHNLTEPTLRSVCKNCGSHNMQARGVARTLTMEYHRYQCKDCGAWNRERKNCLDKDKKDSILTGC